MLLMIDEGLTPVFGYSTPNRDNPLLTQARGVAGHLLFGAVNAVVTEALYRLVRPKVAATERARSIHR